MKASDLLRAIKMIPVIGVNLRESQAARAYAHTFLGGGRTLRLDPRGEYIPAAQYAIEQSLERRGREAVLGFPVTAPTAVGGGAARGLGIESATGVLKGGGLRTRISYTDWHPNPTAPENRKLPMHAGAADPQSKIYAKERLDPYTDLANTFGSTFADVTHTGARLFDHYEFTVMDVNEKISVAEDLSMLLKAIVNGRQLTQPLANISKRYGKPFNIYMDVPLTTAMRVKADKLRRMATEELSVPPWEPR